MLIISLIYEEQSTLAPKPCQARLDGSLEFRPHVQEEGEPGSAGLPLFVHDPPSSAHHWSHHTGEFRVALPWRAFAASSASPFSASSLEG